MDRYWFSTLRETNGPSRVDESWAFHDIFIRALYSSVHIHFETPANITNLSDSRPTFSPSVQCLLDRLESDNRLRNCVQECKITDSTPINRQDQNQYEEFIAPLMTLVGELSNLDNVYLGNLTCHVKWFTYLASRPALRLSIGIWRCTPYGDVMHSGPYTAISLSSNGLIGDVRHIAFGASLRRFDLSFIGTMNLLASHSRLGSPILGALRELYIYDFYPDLINLFRCTPNIVELKFRSQGSINDVNPNGWDGVARKLESFQGDKVLIPLLIVGRPIRSIHLHFHQIRREPILRYFGLDFGSTVPLRQVILPYSRYLEESIEYVSSNCLQVQEFVVTRAFGIKFSKEKMTAYLLKLHKLKELRKLSFMYLESVGETDFEWQRNYCKSLQEEGCSHINEISIDPKVRWTYHSCDSSWTWHQWTWHRR